MRLGRVTAWLVSHSVGSVSPRLSDGRPSPLRCGLSLGLLRDYRILCTDILCSRGYERSAPKRRSVSSEVSWEVTCVSAAVGAGQQPLQSAQTWQVHLYCVENGRLQRMGWPGCVFRPLHAEFFGCGGCIEVFLGWLGLVEIRGQQCLLGINQHPMLQSGECRN